MAWNLKILSHKNAIKPWFSWKIWWGSKKPLKFSGFLLLRKKILLILLEIWKIPQLFATDIRWSLEKFDFLRKISDFYQFCHFRSPFSPTFCHGPKVKPGKFWKINFNLVLKHFWTKLKVSKPSISGSGDFLSILSKSKSNFQNFLPQGAWSLENFEKTADFRRK